MKRENKTTATQAPPLGLGEVIGIQNGTSPTEPLDPRNVGDYLPAARDNPLVEADASQLGGASMGSVMDLPMDMPGVSTALPGVLYAINPTHSTTVPVVGRADSSAGGHLHWYRHLGWDDGTYQWRGPKTVGNGWGEFEHVFGGGDGVIYAVEPIVEARVPFVGRGTHASGGRLLWYRHVGQADGTFRWEGPETVGHGWGGFKHVFAAGDGVIYAVERLAETTTAQVGQVPHSSGGRLLWYRHVGRADGTFRWEGPKVVGVGWSNYSRVFAGGDGIIYAVEPVIEPDVPVVGRTAQLNGGRLIWRKHLGHADGTFRWQGPNVVAEGWGDAEQAFAGADGAIYFVEPAVQASLPLEVRPSQRTGGRLLWYRHIGRADGTRQWVGPRKVGDGWSGLKTVFSNGEFSSVVPVGAGDRICDFLDPPGSPTLGVRAYGLKDGHARSSTLTYSVSGSIPGINLNVVAARALNVWAAATARAPGLSTALSFALLPAGFGADIAISVGKLDPGILGSTSRDGSSITIASGAAWSAQNPVAAGTSSLQAVITHEAGHAIGLLHSTNPASMMFPFGGTLETLGDDDISAVRALYAWLPQQKIGGVGTDASPALCACGSSLVMAWKGINETNLYVSRSNDGITWTPQARVFGAASTDGPSLAWDGFQLWMAFRGIAGDDALYWATCGDMSQDFGQAFSDVTQIPGTGSAVGPSITIFRGKPLLVWRGVSGDQALYYSTYGNGSWAPQQHIGGVASLDRPTVCVDFDGLPRMVWRGANGDDGLWTSMLTGFFWQPQQLLQWIIAGNGPEGTVDVGRPGSDLGPSIISLGGDGSPSFTAGNGSSQKVLLVWRGIPGDEGIYYTQAAPGPLGQPTIEWSTQASIPGVATSHRPAIASFGGQIHVVWKGRGGDHGIWRTIL